MCALVGVVAPEAMNYLSNVKTGLLSMNHRGPDETATVHYSRCILGHNRLILVDAMTGSQPMKSVCGQYAITFNGEIYSYKEIRRKLSPFYTFTTDSDTEVVLALFILKRTSMLSELDGMFSFAIWDNKSQTLFAARDRFGEKPLYYSQINSDSLVFASEIKALRHFDQITPRVSPHAVSNYLQRMYVPPDDCIYDSIKQLAPGNLLTFSGSMVQTKLYWDIPVIDENITREEVAEHSKYLIRKAVRKCLGADFAVGAFLSGGIDSSTIVNAALDFEPSLVTFGMTVEPESEDDLLTKYFTNKTEHNHYQISMPSLGLADTLQELMAVYDEPFADSSGILTSLLSKFARKQVKAVITGDGGDELYGGYTFWYCPLLQKALLNGKSLTGADRAADILAEHITQTSVFSESTILELGLQPKKRSFYETENTLDDVLRYDVQEYLAGDILKKVDMASMASSLECRAPLLDTEHAEFMLKVPWWLKFNSTTDKIPLREMIYEDFPRISTRSKQGFGAPLNIWFNKPDAPEVINHYLLSHNAPIYSILDLKGIKFTLNPLQAWSLLVLSCWLEKNY